MSGTSSCPDRVLTRGQCQSHAYAPQRLLMVCIVNILPPNQVLQTPSYFRSSRKLACPHRLSYKELNHDASLTCASTTYRCYTRHNRNARHATTDLGR
eukprot:5884468-Pleurochrysis_carterae.AAC.2